MKQFRVFLAFFLCAIFGTPSSAGMGEIDSRKPASWENYPQIVRLDVADDNTGGGYCTGEYIAKNLIATAGHCVKEGGKMFTGPITAENFKGETFELKLVVEPSWYDENDFNKANGDYAILQVVDPKYNMESDWYNLVGSLDKEKKFTVSNLGFGSMTILSSAEVKKLKKIYDDYLDELCTQKEGSMKDGQCKRSSTLTYKLEINSSELNNRFESIADGYKQYNGLGRELADGNRLKMHSGCIIQYDGKEYKNGKSDVWTSNCDTFTGNSGGAYIDSKGNLLGVHSGSNKKVYDFTNDNLTNLASADIVKKKLNELFPNNTIPDVNSDALTTISDQDIEELNQTNAAAEQELHDRIQQMWADTGDEITNVDPSQITSDTGFIHAVVAPMAQTGDKIKKLEKAYKKAKEREQSLANRTLSSLTMAATGIGGMELARGLAEQKADKAAEADMTAYMSTFQCKVGDKRYTGNDTQIEIAGGNELIKLYQEYVDLANSLKERKAALGKKAGIESEVILDKANMGLYDETGKGIENGTYASLYRAARGNENDAAKIQEQQDASKKRVIAGAVVGGAGAVGGMVGNILINGKDNKDEDNTVSEEGIIDTVSSGAGEVEEKRKNEEVRVSDLEKAPVNTRTPGCTVNSSVSTIPDACKSHYASDANEQARCLKCVNNAGTYEAGRCYVEVIGWACLGKGWPQDNKPNSPAPCATAANRYQDCHIVRKYADAEKPFTCDPMTSIAPGKTALVSGCGQHGWSVGDKHPPFNLDGPNAVGQNCKLPLSSNMAWRKMYSKGSAIGVTFSGKTVTTGRWCMPSANSSPWNDSNHSGAAKHLLSSSLMAGGESKDKWFSLD